MVKLVDTRDLKSLGPYTSVPVRFRPSVQHISDFSFMQILDNNQFFFIAFAHFLAVVSPGPDFILINRQSFLYGRSVAIFTSLGIGFGIIIHSLYCIVGLNFLSQNQIIISFLRLICGFYLIYLGYYSLVSSSLLKSKEKFNDIKKTLTFLNAFKIGFITNVLNVKATFFFLSIYVFIASSPTIVKLFYGIWMSLITSFWFIFLSIILTSKFVEEKTYQYQVYINKLMGVILVYLGLDIIYNLFNEIF